MLFRIGAALVAYMFLSNPVVLAKKKDPEKSWWFDYDASFTYSDNGSAKTDGVDPDATMVAGQTGYLGFSAEVKKDVTADVYYSLFGDTLNGGLEVAKATQRFNKMFSASVGVDYTNMLGWDNKNLIFSTIVYSPIVDNSPLAASATMFQAMFSLGAAGDITLQFLDDQGYELDESGNAQFGALATQKQPAVTFQWMGSFGPVTPLVQVVPYDEGRSLSYAVGLGVEAAGLTAYLDYVSDSRTMSKSITGGEEVTDVQTSINLDLLYAAGAVSPFLKVVSYDKVQDGTDLEVNSDADTIDDNALIWTVGTNLDFVADYWVPYVALKSTSFAVNDANGEKETRTNMDVILGVGGTI